MRSRERLIAVSLAMVATAGLAGGCTIDNTQDKAAAGKGSIQKIDALSGTKLKVSSKEFDEQLLLGQIAIVALQAAGANPVDKTNITGSSNVRRALTTGAVDLYWEYTGTGWVDYLKHTKPIADPAAQYAAVKKDDTANQVTWWARSPANDTYAIAANPQSAKKFGATTLSQYAALAKKDPADGSTCIGPEFKSRDDGFPGLEKAYGFNLPSSQIKLLNDAVIYPTLGKGGTCNFGEVASTDGRVSAQKLTVLQDDKGFFPVYNPAITIRTPLAKKYPQLEGVFEKVAAKLTTQKLTQLNEKVSVDGEKASAVATNWMKSEGFIG